MLRSSKCIADTDHIANKSQLYEEFNYLYFSTPLLTARISILLIMFEIHATDRSTATTLSG